MVLRKKRICNRCDDVQLQVSFGIPDVKNLFKIYASLIERTKDIPQSETDIRFWLEHDGRAFLSWPEKWRKQLSGWCFSVAVRNNLLEPTATNENRYYLSDCLFVKRGRPHKEA